MISYLTGIKSDSVEGLGPGNSTVKQIGQSNIIFWGEFWQKLQELIEIDWNFAILHDEF